MPLHNTDPTPSFGGFGLMGKLQYGYCRVSRAADEGTRNLDTQQQVLEAVGIRHQLI